MPNCMNRNKWQLEDLTEMVVVDFTENRAEREQPIPLSTIIVGIRHGFLFYLLSFSCQTELSITDNSYLNCSTTKNLFLKQLCNMLQYFCLFLQYAFSFVCALSLAQTLAPTSLLKRSVVKSEGGNSSSKFRIAMKYTLKCISAHIGICVYA